MTQPTRRRTALLWLGLALGLIGAARDTADRWIEATALPPLVAETSVEVVDRSGALLRAYTVADGLWRLPVQLDDVDPRFLDYLINYEDRRFWTHPGVDIRALARAAVQAARNGRIVSGGSTLTMQVARLLEDGSTGALDGKLRQMRVALALERRLSKRQILELYLTHAPYGGNLEGIRAATRAWYGKSPRRLTPSEAALLVALPQAPRSRQPDRAPEAARRGRDKVLARMVTFGILSEEEATASLRDPLPAARRPFPVLAAHLADRLRTDAPERQLHRTTLDARLQAGLEALALRSAQTAGPSLSAALVVADHSTGDVLAHIGAARFDSDARGGWVDMTAAPRSPGSTLKPLIYGLAFEAGMGHPDTIIDDRPVSFRGYAPVNFDGGFRGPVRMAEALQLSLNTPVVSLMDRIGPSRLMARLRRAGANPQLPSDAAAGLAVALGGVGLTLEDLVRLYGSMARDGAAMPLRLRPEDVADAGAAPVLSSDSAWQVGHVLAGMPPPPHGPRQRIAYKTGTSYGYRDAWAIGFDGAHVIGVWVGRPDGAAVPGLSGAGAAAPLLFEAMTHLKPRAEPLRPPPPTVLPGPTSALPAPLQRFRQNDDAVAPDPDAPRLVFPPSGSQIAAPDLLALKVSDGTPPFTWLVRGAPVATEERRRETLVPSPGPGHHRLAVIDAKGRVAHADIIVTD